MEYPADNKLYNIIYLRNQLSSGHDNVPAFFCKKGRMFINKTSDICNQFIIRFWNLSKSSEDRRSKASFESPVAHSFFRNTGIFWDLFKAFNCVNHSILLFKLYKYGIRGLPYECHSSYLSERKHYTALTSYGNIVSEVYSDVVDIKHGVPQGSTLGLVLFLLYFSDS